MPELRRLGKRIALLGWLILGVFRALPGAGAEEVPFDGYVAVGFRNQYNFRGFKAGNWAPSIAFHLVIPARADRGLALDVGGWYVNPIDVSYDELGIHTYVLVPVSVLQFRVGGIFFAFPSEDWVTGEFGAAVSCSALGFVDLELAWWSDVKGDGFAEDEVRFGHYAEFRVEKAIELQNWLGVELAAGVSYAINYYDSDGWNHAFASVDFPIGLSETVSLIPHLGGTLALEGLDEAGEDDQFLAGIRVSVEF